MRLFNILDADESQWMLNKALMVDKIIDSKISQSKNSCSTYHLQELQHERFFTQRLIIELTGKNNQIEDCQRILEKQSSLLAIIERKFPKFPSILAMHWEQLILKDHLDKSNSEKRDTLRQAISTPDVILKLEEMSINPSGNTFAILKVIT